MSDEKTNELLNKILSEQKESREEHQETFAKINALDKKVDLHIQEMKYELQMIHEQDARQNTLIDEHIEGVNSTRELIKQHAKSDEKMFKEVADRLMQVEAPSRLKTWYEVTLQILGGVGTVLGLVWLILKFFGV